MPETTPPTHAGRSEEVQEILSHAPRWMIRWGTALIVFLMMLFIAVSFVFRYPEVVSGEIIISAENRPLTLVANQSGKLVAVPKREGVLVDSGQRIATLYSTLSEADFIALSTELDRLQGLTTSQAPKPLLVGDLQPSYNALSKAWEAYQQARQDPVFEENERFLGEKIASLEEMATILSKQQDIIAQQLVQAQDKHRINTALYESGGSTTFDFYDSQAQLSAVESNVQNIRKEQVNLRLQINELRNQRKTLALNQEQSLRESKSSLEGHIRGLQESLEQWQQDYIIHAPIAGQLSFAQPWQANAFVKAGEPLFALIPQHGGQRAEGIIPPEGRGKVRIGQQARINLSGYPYQEFGYLEGEVLEVSPLPLDKGYRVVLSLPQGLITHYGQAIPYRPQMPGTLEIITQDLSLAERFLHSVRERLRG